MYLGDSIFSFTKHANLTCINDLFRLDDLNNNTLNNNYGALSKLSAKPRKKNLL